MTSLSMLQNLKAERLTITKKLAPINTLMASKRGELSMLQADIAAADGALHAAIQHAANVEGRVMIEAATREELTAAKQSRKDAESGHAATQAASAGVRSLMAELDGLSEAGRAMGLRLGAIANEEATAQERYLRELADEAAAEYAAIARALTQKLASILAFQQALASANLNPDLTTAGVFAFGVPALNSPSARTASGGALVEYEHAKAQQREQLEAILARLLADAVTVPGLT